MTSELLDFNSIKFSSGLSRHEADFSDQFFFLTSYTPSPFLVFDLPRARAINSITLNNRPGSLDIRRRIVGLILETSLDAINYSNHCLLFDDDLFSANASINMNVKFIRLSLPGPGIIHLKEIIIKYNESNYFNYLGSVPLVFDYGFLKNGIYYPTNNAGFFSICSTTFFDLARSQLPIEEINGCFSFSLYRDDDRIEYNPRSDFFFIDNEAPFCIDPSSFSNGLLNHSRYENLDFSTAKCFLLKYFQPSADVLNRINFFTSKYCINPNQTVALSIRGTDKELEVALTDNSKYLDCLLDVLRAEPDLRILIQTDQLQIRDYFLSKIANENLFFVNELPFSDSNVGVHTSLTNDKKSFAIDFLAMVFIMSKCKYLITHTGNVAYWTVLFRGSFDRVFQF
jgi:hypothetical protein